MVVCVLGGGTERFLGVMGTMQCAKTCVLETCVMLRGNVTPIHSIRKQPKRKEDNGLCPLAGVVSFPYLSKCFPSSCGISCPGRAEQRAGQVRLMGPGRPRKAHPLNSTFSDQNRKGPGPELGPSHFHSGHWKAVTGPGRRLHARHPIRFRWTHLLEEDPGGSRTGSSERILYAVHCRPSAIS